MRGSHFIDYYPKVRIIYMSNTCNSLYHFVSYALLKPLLLFQPRLYSKFVLNEFSDIEQRHSIRLLHFGEQHCWIPVSGKNRRQHLADHEAVVFYHCLRFTQSSQ